MSSVDCSRTFPWWRISAGLALGLGLCIGLIVHLDVREEDGRRLIQGLSWPWIGAVAALTIALWWSGARKWALWSKALHHDDGSEPSPGFFWRHFSWQNWYGQFMPPSVAIVLGRCWATRHMPRVSWREGAGNALYDQAAEFVLLAGFLPASFLVLHFHASWTLWLPAACFGLCGAGCLVVLLRSWLPAGVQTHLRALLLWSALRVVLTVLRLVAGAPALGLALDAVNIAAAAPVVALLVLIPATPGNLGLAEWGWAGVLAYAGENVMVCGLLALGFRVLMLVVQSVLLVLSEAIFFARKQYGLQTHDQRSSL